MKRTSLLCLLAVVLMVVMAFPAWAAVELFAVGVETPVAPAYINYTLNCTSLVTVDILSSDAAGVLTLDTAGNPLPPVYTELAAPGLKGKNTYLWPCIDTAGLMAPIGWYVAKITATNAPTGRTNTGAPNGLYRWDANIGLFKNWQRPAPVSEWPYYAYPIPLDSAGNPLPQIEVRSLPYDTNGATDETINGFYGVGVNHNTASLYYGRIYATHVTNQDIYMYDVDGTFIGRMIDDTVTWMTSAPWDISIAEDDYVYVSDRTNMYVYCFSPEGALKSRSPATTNDRGIFASYDPVSTRTYVYVSNGTNMYQYDVQADHLTWNPTIRWRCAPLDFGGESVYGMWVSPDQLTMYCTNRGGGGWTGLRRYTRASTTTRFANDATWTNNFGAIPLADVEMGHDGTYLWASVSTVGGGIYKVDVATGAAVLQTNTTTNIAAWAFMLARDGVGNVFCGFGKSSPTWASKYMGMFAEGVATTKEATTVAFYCPANPAPVIVPGSEQWTYSTGYGELCPDGTDTATVTFKVLDANADTANPPTLGISVDIDLKELKTTADTSTVQPPDTMLPDTSDPNGLTVICTKTVKATNGVPYGNHEIGLTCYDNAGHNHGELNVWAAGNIGNTYVKHTRTSANIPGATLRLVGGVPGVYGYGAGGFTVESPYASDLTGYVELYAAEGNYDVTAVRSGYKTISGVTVAMPVVEALYGPYGKTVPIATNVYLAPMSVAEARAYGGDLLYCSVEGLVYAHPKGFDGTVGTGFTFVPGLDKRLDISMSATENFFKHSWYMCDPGDPTNGMQFQLKMTAAQGEVDSLFNRQWDDTSLKDNRSGNSFYIGKRPADGDTICLSGVLETRPTYETKMAVDDAFLDTAASGDYRVVYYNLTQFDIVLTQALPDPTVMTIPQIYHSNIGPRYFSQWGKFAELKDVRIVAWYPNGDFFPATPPYMPADRNQFVVVADSAGNWGTVTFQSLTSYGMPADVCPVELGTDVLYTFKGAVGRRARQAEGTIRPRGAADISEVGHPDPAIDTVSAVRGKSSGWVSVRGIVTAKFGTTSCYVESTDRSVGVKVMPCPAWVNEGDDVIVRGYVHLDGIDKHIDTDAGPHPHPIVVLANGNPSVVDLGMRTRDVGGHTYGDLGTVTDPGITYGRGPLNVGLYVTIQGTVTYCDTTGVSPAFYVWDGTNMVKPMEPSKPLYDDNPYGYIGLRVAHNGALGAPYNRALLQYQDFVTIKGIVGLDNTTVPGQVIPVILPISITPETPPFATLYSAPGVALNWNADIGDMNQLSIPGVPAKVGTGEVPDPMSGINPYPWDPTVVFAGTDQDITNVGVALLNRVENATGGTVFYDVWAPDEFGGVNSSDGYWVNLVGGVPWYMSFSGLYSEIPQWYAVELPGDVLVGFPHNYNTELDQVKVSNGRNVYSFMDAGGNPLGLGLNWLDSVGFWYNNQDGTTYGVGVPDDYTDGTTLEPWRGYLFKMVEGQKAWIIP